jgi:drug/metabolite transporter (DMT)-like permease
VIWVYLPIFGIHEVPSLLTVIGGCIVSGAIVLNSLGSRHEPVPIKPV